MNLFQRNPKNLVQDFIVFLCDVIWGAFLLSFLLNPCLQNWIAKNTLIGMVNTHLLLHFMSTTPNHLAVQLILVVMPEEESCVGWLVYWFGGLVTIPLPSSTALTSVRLGKGEITLRSVRNCSFHFVICQIRHPNKSWEDFKFIWKQYGNYTICKIFKKNKKV